MVRLPHLLPSLKALSISASSEMLLRSVANYSSFAKLSITGFPGLTYLPEELGPNHASLHSLEIRDCQNLMSLSIQLQNLLAVKTLIIEECANLVLSLPDGSQQQRCPLNSSCENQTFPLGDGIVSCGNFESSSSDGLQNLTSPVIKNCPNALTCPDFLEKLKSLGILKISRCSDMMNLPESMKKLASLTYLEIANCPNIMCLPESVGDLTLLRSLWIIECPGITTMPEGLQRLTNLQELYVRGCHATTARTGIR